MTDLIENLEPLQPGYSPEKLEFREEVLDRLSKLLSRPNAAVLLRGVHGSGKTELGKHAVKQSEALNNAFVSCTERDTQYKVLQALLEEFVEPPGVGHHTADLQRKLEKRIKDVETLLVLDDVEFLLLNDGDELLYTLSRLPSDTRILMTGSPNLRLDEELDERTYSSLNPREPSLEPPTGEETYQVLASRARSSLRPQSLHREALTLIASTTQNLELGLTWLRESAKQADEVITEEVAAEARDRAEQRYAEQKLGSFTDHHRSLYRAVREALQDQEFVRRPC